VKGIAFTSERDGNREIYLIQPDGTELTRLTSDPSVDSDPAWSPDGTKIAFRSRRGGSSDIFIMGADGSTPINIIKDRPDSMDDEFSPAWHPEGLMLAIYTDRFLPPMGDCRGSLGVHHLAFIPLEEEKPTIRHFDDLSGEQSSPTWSPDGKTLAFSSICNENNARIYLWNLDSREITRLTNRDTNAAGPAFSPVEQFLAFSSVRERASDIFILDLKTGEVRNLTQSEHSDRQPTWSPDGRQIAFTRNVDGNDDIFVIDIDGRNLLRLTDHPSRDILPAWSPVP
jgi:Tol biopolymer transport system component